MAAAGEEDMMNKKILAAVTVMALGFGGAALAANPFSDVSPDDWAYQAVSDLSDQGVVEGYPDGTFRGEKNMTRYELAQIIARLLAKEDQLNGEQRAAVDKLAGEYSDELANLGVRVGNLEKKVGNISWSGDARMRYLKETYKAAKYDGKDDVWDGRIRLWLKAQVNKDTTVNGRLTTNMDFKGTTDDGGQTTMDMLYVNHKFGKAVDIRIGRYMYKLGNQGGWIYGKAKGWDGAEVMFHVDPKVDLYAGYGQPNTGDTKGPNRFEFRDKNFFYGGANVRYMPGGALKLGYLKKTGSNSGNNNYQVFDADMTVPLGSDWRLLGEWARNMSGEKATGWNVGLGYGKMQWKKPGSFQLELYYNDVEKGIYHGGAPIQETILDVTRDMYMSSPKYRHEGHDATFWNLMGDLALAKNVSLHAEYGFGADVKGGDDPDGSWTMSVNYKF